MRRENSRVTKSDDGNRHNAVLFNGVSLKAGFLGKRKGKTQGEVRKSYSKYVTWSFCLRITCPDFDSVCLGGSQEPEF